MDTRREWKLSNTRRRFDLAVRVLVFAGPFAGVAAVILNETQILAFLSIWFGAIAGIALDRYVRWAKREDYLSARFIVSEAGIQKVKPSGQRLEGSWNDLRHVRWSGTPLPGGLILEFRNTVITIPYNFLHRSGLLHAMKVASGPNSCLWETLARTRESRAMYFWFYRDRFIMSVICCLWIAAAAGMIGLARLGGDYVAATRLVRLITRREFGLSVLCAGGALLLGVLAPGLVAKLRRR